MPDVSSLDAFLIGIKKAGVDLITLHWTVGHYDQTFLNDYHFQIRSDGSVFVDPRAFDSDGNFVPLAHAWHHNTANIGISLCSMLNGSDPGSYPDPKIDGSAPTAYGQYPPTAAQYEKMCELVSALVRHYGLGFDKVYTHYDLAQEDGYKGERWEFKYEKPLILQRVRDIYEATKPT